MSPLWPFERTPNEPRPPSQTPQDELRAFLERLLPVLNGAIWYDAEALILFYDAKRLLEEMK